MQIKYLKALPRKSKSITFDLIELEPHWHKKCRLTVKSFKEVIFIFLPVHLIHIRPKRNVINWRFNIKIFFSFIFVFCFIIFVWKLSNFCFLNCALRKLNARKKTKDDHVTVIVIQYNVIDKCPFQFACKRYFNDATALLPDLQN